MLGEIELALEHSVWARFSYNYDGQHHLSPWVLRLMANRHSNAGLLDRTDEEIQNRFHEFLSKWKSETAFLSSVTHRAMHPAYQALIGLGPRSVPFLLQELNREPCDLFWALQAITGEDPVAPEDRGKFKKMAQAWLEWGARRGLSP
jgi:hypothetical protein